MKFKKILEVIIENWPAKVLSFVFAIILVQFYKGSLLEKKYFSVPLVIENSGELVPTVILPKTVNVSVWGESSLIAPIREDDIIAFVDFSVFDTEGDYHVSVQTKLKGSAANVTPLEIKVDPGELDVKLEKSLTKRVDIKLSLKGSPFKGYEIYETGLDPSSVEISGPVSVVSKINDIFTNNIQMASRKTGFSGYVDISRTNSLVSVIGTGKIAYSVKIREIAETKTYKNLSVFFEDLDKTLEVSEPPLGFLTVKGASSILSSWKPPANVLKVSCANILKPGIYNFQVQAVVPGKLELVNAEPKNIQVEIKFKDVDNLDEVD